MRRVSEYPPSDYRRLVAGRRGPLRRRRPTSSWSAPAPTRSWTSSPRRSSHRAAAPSSRRRPTRCTASAPSSEARRPWPCPACGPDEGWAIDAPAVAAAAASAALVWLCSPNNPTALADARRRDRRASSLASPADAEGAGREAPIVVLDEAYAEFVGASLAGLRAALPQPDRRPDRQQGLCPGRASGSASRSPGRS